MLRPRADPAERDRRFLGHSSPVVAIQDTEEPRYRGVGIGSDPAQGAHRSVPSRLVPALQGPAKSGHSSSGVGPHARQRQESESETAPPNFRMAEDSGPFVDFNRSIVSVLCIFLVRSPSATSSA